MNPMDCKRAALAALTNIYTIVDENEGVSNELYADEQTKQDLLLAFKLQDTEQFSSMATMGIKLLLEETGMMESPLCEYFLKFSKSGQEISSVMAAQSEFKARKKMKTQ